VRETMDLPDGAAIVAGLVADESAAGRLIASLTEAGAAPHSIRVGAKDAERAQAIAAMHGARADIAIEDPLAGAPGLATALDQRSRVDRGGLIGAGIGAVAGSIVGAFPGTRFMAVDPAMTWIADGLLFFVVGAVAGSVLGGAFGPRLSTHAGFRLVDGMDEGALAVIVECTRDRTTMIRAVFDEAGAHDVVVIG